MKERKREFKNAQDKEIEKIKTDHGRNMKNMQEQFDEKVNV